MTLEGAKKRDSILRELIAIRSFTTISLSQQELSRKTGIENKYLISYLDLLRQDKHIEITTDHEKSDRTWHATHTGIIFTNEEGGYEGALKSKNKEKLFQSSILILTAGGTVVAAIATSLLFAWTVWTYFRACQCCCQ